MEYGPDEVEDEGGVPSPRKLPDDLPRSLDDRRNVPLLGQETEIYDAWQGRRESSFEQKLSMLKLRLGQTQFLTTPMPARPMHFNLALDDQSYGQDDVAIRRLEDSDNKLMEMLASQQKLKDDNSASGEDAILSNKTLNEKEQRDALQSMLTMAASNGEVDRVRRILNGQAKEFVDVNAPDAEGTPPLIYASCFGHEEVVSVLLDAGAEVDKQDKNQWSSLMWAMTNRHKTIAKLLLDHGASPEIKSSTGRTAFDFLAPNSEMSDYLHESGYNIGNVGVTDDFYNAGFSQDRFEEEMAESEMRRRMMMESALNLEVDLGNLGLDEQPESPDLEEGQEFAWDRCLNDQMFVFQESELDRILDIIITNMTPQRSPSQKPVPANILFLSARYAHYHASAELLETLLLSAMDKINDTVERYHMDMTILAFWMSNATLLLYYLKKDPGLVEATSRFQLHLAELINEIFILITRDAERRMNRVLDTAMLDHETIPGFEDVHFQNEWKFFRSKTKVKDEPLEKRFRPPSPKRRAQTSPRNITSLLSSTLFVLDLYDVHSVITTQVISQLLYWLSANLFNRILSKKKYLARTKAMQVRMNVSTLEDWARANNRKPEHYEQGSMTSTGETTVEAASRHLAPVVQLLQWLQCFSSLGEDFDALIDTIQQLPRLSPQQLVYAAKNYRAEVGEKGLSKTALKYLIDLQREMNERKLKQKKEVATISPQVNAVDAAPATPTKKEPQQTPGTPTSPLPQGAAEDEDAPEQLTMDVAYQLPFTLPTSTDMLVSYGAGFGGLNRERERKYIPTVPPEFLAKLDTTGSTKNGSAFDASRWE